MLVNVRALNVLWRGLLVLAFLAACGYATGQPVESFDAFIAALRVDATTRGITRATFDAGMAGLTPDPAVIGAMRGSPNTANRWPPIWLAWFRRGAS